MELCDNCLDDARKCEAEFVLQIGRNLEAEVYSTCKDRLLKVYVPNMIEGKVVFKVIPIEEM